MDSSYFSTQFTEALTLFLKNLKKEHSRKEYLAAAVHICDFFEKDFFLLNEQDADIYKESLISRRLTKRSVLTKMSYLGSMASFFIEQKLSPETFINPFIHTYESLDTQFMEHNILFPEELNAIFEASCKTPDLYLIFAFLVRMALSPTEIISLTSESFLWDDSGRTYVAIKQGSNQRTIPVPDDIVCLLDEYPLSGEYLFTNFYGRRLSLRSLELRVSEFFQKSNLPAITMQMLKNTGVFYMLSGGASHENVAAYTGLTSRWFHRYRGLLEHTDISPCNYSRIRVLPISELPTK